MLTVILFVISPRARADLNQGLVAYYPFDGNANDTSGNGNNGIIYGATFQTNIAGHAIALSCNGTSGTYVQVPRSASLEPTNAISISFWCKGVPGAGANYGTILRKADGCQPGYIIRTAGYRPDVTPRFKIDLPNPCTYGDVNAAFLPCTNSVWQHFAATYSRTNGWIKSYVDGVEVNLTPFAMNLQHSGDLFIGGATVGGDDGGFDGLIDDLRIYNRELSAGEVAQLAGAPNPANIVPLPKGTNFTSFIVITDANLVNNAWKCTIATLQGIVARQSATQIYIDGGGGDSIWKNHLRDTYGIPYTTVSTPAAVLTQFVSQVSGYVLYDFSANSNSINAATSLCGPNNAIAVDASIESTVRSYGITNRIADVRTWNNGFVWTNYNAAFSRNAVIEQVPSIVSQLRDYATLANAYTFFVGNTPFRTFIMSQMNPDSACLGWGDPSAGESAFVGDSSSNGVYTCAADFARNLSILSGIRDDSLRQRTYTTPVSETNVHYVTFLVLDGDNVEINLGTLQPYFSNPARGQFDMGWGISPTLVDLAPSVLRWFFDNASNSPAGQDFFVAGPSGSGYFYPSMLPPADLSLQVVRLNEQMARADLSIVHIIDINSVGRVDLWNKYLAQPCIDALLYFESTADGQILFSANGKPIIAMSAILAPTQGQTVSNLVAMLNAAPRDPSDPKGYSLIGVGFGPANLGDVFNVITNAAPGIRVVTPNALARLVRDNVGRKLSYDLATGVQGWNAGTSGKSLDNAWWSANGHPGGSLEMDGSDFGVSDSQPNAWFSRQIILPPNATAMNFDTLAENDGLLRVRLQRADGGMVTLLDWEGMTNHNVWTNRTVDIANYAGQTVTFYFEQNDGGQGSGEIRYVDNVVIQTAGLPLYRPAAPRLLSAGGSYAVNLLWRDDDNNEAGFKVERSHGSSGTWTEVASVPTNITSYVDSAVSPCTNYSYRVRSWNAAGYSDYSNVRTVTTAPIPSMTLSISANMIGLTWPSWASNFTLYTTTNLGPGAVWLPVTSVSNLDGSFSNGSPILPGNRFFRLKDN